MELQNNKKYPQFVYIFLKMFQDSHNKPIFPLNFISSNKRELVLQLCDFRGPLYTWATRNDGIPSESYLNQFDTKKKISKGGCF